MVEKPKFFVSIIGLFAGVLVLDTSISYVADFLADFNRSLIGIALFIGITVFGSIGFYIILKFIRIQIRSIRAGSISINLLHLIVTGMQCALLVTSYIVILQIFILSEYSTALLTFVTFISNAASASLLGWFSLRFFSWFADNKKSLIILLYALSFSVLCFSEFIVAYADTFLLMNKNQYVNAESEIKFYDFEEGTFFAVFYDFYDYIDMAAFLLMLAATAFLLYHYSTNMSKIKIVIIICLPLLSYMSGYLDTLNIYDTDTNPDLFTYYIFQSLSTISAGILFAVSMWVVVRRMNDKTVKNFMITTACGFVLFYITNSASVTVSPFPPFGLAALSFLPLSTFLILIGIYCSALTLSQNISLRNSIRTMAAKDANLLLNLGMSQMDSQIKKMVSKFRDKIKQEEEFMTQKTGIETDLQSEEIEDYVKTVLNEIIKVKSQKEKK